MVIMLEMGTDPVNGDKVRHEIGHVAKNEPEDGHRGRYWAG